MEYSSGVRKEDRKYQTRCRLKGRKSVVGLEEEADQYIDIRSGVDRKVVLQISKYGVDVNYESRFQSRKKKNTEKEI